MKKGLKKFTIAAVIAGVLIIVLAGTIMAAGPFGGGNTSSGASGGCGNGLGPGGGIDESVADLLGMTREQIQEQRQAGKSLVQIAETQGIAEETLINTIVAARQEELKARVSAGTMNQNQVDQCLVQMRERVQLAVNRTTVGHPEWAGANGNGQDDRQGGLRSQTNTGAGGNCTGTGKMMRAGRNINQ